MLARCGRAAHICGANRTCKMFFLLQLHFLELANSQFDCLCETSCKFGQGNGAIAARWQAKAGVKPPFAGCLRPFSLGGIALRKTTCVWFGRIALLSASVLFAGGCVVRIGFASLFDYSFYEVLLLLKWRTAFLPILFRFQYLLSFCSLQGTAVPCTPRQAEPA